MMEKKLMRSNDRVWAGVCGGIAEYLDFDPVLVRVAYAFLTLFTAFSGLIFYIVLWIVMPERNLLEK
jgi:phage shock protein PspC (stress-responsive transcriptional regulator)